MGRDKRKHHIKARKKVKLDDIIGSIAAGGDAIESKRCVEGGQK